MKYVGIDLGTTNSAIATFDGQDLQLLKSPEQHDVTPSAIYADRRGNRYVGARAYSNAALDPDNAAVLFKRQMGSSTPFKLPNLDRVLTPEECSAEILKVVYGYLPPEVRDVEDSGTVITVPAAFDQMQRDATLAAANAAGIGRVALMQEPVAAVMSVMRQRKSDGVFLIYDLGGGTLDIAVAQSIAGRVNLLAHGGIAMCGGRDFDRAIVESVALPWLQQSFELSEDLNSPENRRLYRLCAWAAEKAKIELSQRDAASITLSEAELNQRDGRGQELYLDAPLDRRAFDPLIADQVGQSVEAARRTLAKAGLDPRDVERMVFIGGPTFYPPLRERVAAELGIAASTEVNGMTAVAEGAAVFAENIDWSTTSRSRKSGRGQIASAPLAIAFHFAARTPSDTTRLSVDLTGEVTPGSEFQIDCLDTGWSSGRLPLRRGGTVELPLAKAGENLFRALVFDAAGGPLALGEDRIVIMRTAAAIDAIPASHSIAIEVRERAGGPATLDYLVREGEPLPKSGRRIYKAETTLKPDDAHSLNFKLWEGEIIDPITDNQPIGVFSIHGADLSDRPIPAGADLVCDYEVLDSGNIILQVQVPAIEGSFDSGRNFYSRQAGQIDFGQAEGLLLSQAQDVVERLERLAGRVPEEDLEPAKARVQTALSRARVNDPESARRAASDLTDAKRALAQTRMKHLQAIREVEFERITNLFNEELRGLATPGEVEAFDAAARNAEASIARPDMRFEEVLETLRRRALAVLWRQDSFIAERFAYLTQSPHMFLDQAAFERLAKAGEAAMSRNDAAALRRVVTELDDVRMGSADDIDLSRAANIVRAHQP